MACPVVELEFTNGHSQVPLVPQRDQRNDRSMDLSKELARCSVFFYVTVRQVWPTREDIGEAQRTKFSILTGPGTGSLRKAHRQCSRF